MPINNGVTSKVTFDADFECANLDQVRLKTQTVFDCWMRNDSNGVGNLQWFYFRMKNTSDFVETIRINIVNFTKANSLFNSVSGSRVQVLTTSRWAGDEAVDLVDEDEQKRGGWREWLDSRMLRKRELRAFRVSKGNQRFEPAKAAQLLDHGLRLHIHVRERRSLRRLHGAVHLHNAAGPSSTAETLE